MAQFVDLKLEATTTDDLDRIAVENNGIVANGTGSFYCRTSPIDNIGDWGFRWVGTAGTGNQGTLVLVAKSARTRTLLLSGFAAFLREEYRIDMYDAVKIAGIARTVQYGREPRVLSYVIKNLQACCAWASAGSNCFTARQRAKWASEWGMPPADVSAMRWQAIVTIAREYHGLESVIFPQPPETYVSGGYFFFFIQT